MGVIIGAATTVSFSGGHATQVSWGINPNVQRAYVLGDWNPYTPAQIKAPTETLSLTVYSPGPSYGVLPTQACEDANKIAASVSPAACGAASGGPSTTNWFVSSYNYSKGDARTPGTESWSMTEWVTLGDSDVVLPSFVLRGISEGSITSDETDSAAAGVVAGITFTGQVDEGTQGSVSAGQFGRSDYQYSGVITTVGNSQGGTGDICSGNCSMPYTPLYL